MTAILEIKLDQNDNWNIFIGNDNPLVFTRFDSVANAFDMSPRGTNEIGTNDRTFTITVIGDPNPTVTTTIAGSSHTPFAGNPLSSTVTIPADWPAPGQEANFEITATASAAGSSSQSAYVKVKRSP